MDYMRTRLGEWSWVVLGVGRVVVLRRLLEVWRTRKDRPAPGGKGVGEKVEGGWGRNVNGTTVCKRLSSGCR